MLSYAGVILPALCGELVASIESRISLDGIYPWDSHISSIGAGGFGLAAQKWRDESIRLGRLKWPTGASRWAKAFYVVSTEQLNDIRAVVYGNTTPEAPYYQSAPLVIGDGIRSISAQMFMLTPRPLVGNTLPESDANPDPQGLWLLPLVDQRYFWWKFRTGNLQIISNDTWATLLARIAALVDVSLAVDKYSNYYVGPGPINLNLVETLVPPLLDTVSQAIGQRIVVGLDGIVSSQGWASAADVADSNLLAISESETPPVQIGGGPLQITTVVGEDIDTPTIFPSTISVDFMSSGGAVTSYPIAVNQLSGFADMQTSGGNLTLFHPYQTVQSQQASYLASQFAYDYCNWLLSDQEYVYGGIAEWDIEGYEDCIEWDYSSAIARTRVERMAAWGADAPSQTFVPVSMVEVLENTPQTVYLGRQIDGVTLVSGSVVVTGPSANFSTNDIGKTIQGTGIPSNPVTTIVSLNTDIFPITANLSAPATQNIKDGTIHLITNTMTGYAAQILPWNLLPNFTSATPVGSPVWWSDVNYQLAAIPMPPKGFTVLAYFTVLDAYNIPIYVGGSYYGATGTDGIGNIFVCGTCVNVGGPLSIGILDGGSDW